MWAGGEDRNRLDPECVGLEGDLNDLQELGWLLW